MREEILYKKSRTGTTIVYFDTLLQPEEEGQNFAYLTLNNIGQPTQVTTFDGTIKWARNFPFTPLVNIDTTNTTTVTGTCFNITVENTYSEDRKDIIRTQFINEMNTQFSGLSNTYVFFREQEVDDLFITVGLERSYKTIDTLKIYNNLTNSFPTQESNTGTVFGRLEAIQKVTDRSGNNIKIPLRNVPIGIFSESETFSDATSVDENGNRITFNLKEGSTRQDYFNNESFSADTQNILASGSHFETVPEHYKYMTYTNEEGEFVIHNVPTGTQTLVFEVDLFKQGMTKDEIALNFFPFPVDPEPNVDTVPSLYFRQFAIDVVPTWGGFQTGYTEVNIQSNLDLRKWTTFFVPPVTLDSNNIEQLQAQGISEPIKVQVRDMSTNNYPIRNIEIVEIPNIRDREENQQLIWRNEFKQLKSQAEFRRKGWNAFKVPANAYDPIGFKTDREGVPTASRGVWLACYQYKLFYDSPLTNYRASGQRKVVLDNDTHVRRDHFHLNYPYEEYQNSNTQSERASLGTFPYERTWDHLYPEPYSIPTLPTQVNLNYSQNNSSTGNIIENPRYLDGDRIGHPFVPPAFTDEGFGGGTGGYGVAFDAQAETSGTGVWYTTDFSRLIAKNTYYRYENRGYPLEEYASGYRPNDSNFSISPLISQVVNGEKYQRTECGYSYFMRPEGWARVANYPWWGSAEAIVTKDLDVSTNAQQRLVQPQEVQNSIIALEPKYNSMDVVSNVSGQEISLNLGVNTPNQLREGYLDFYRIVNSNPSENLNEPTLVAQVTKAIFNFGFVRIQNAHTASQVPKFKLDTEQEDFQLSNGVFDANNINTINNAQIYIKNLGVKNSSIKAIGGNEFMLAPGQELLLTASDLGLFGTSGLPKWNGLRLEVEANDGFDYVEGYYKLARYKFEFRNVEFFKRRNGNGANNFRLRNSYNIQDLQNPLVNPPGFQTKIYHLQSISSPVKVKSNIFGVFNCNGNFYRAKRAIMYNGILWDGYAIKTHFTSFWKDSLINDWSCTNGSEVEYFKLTNSWFSNG